MEALLETIRSAVAPGASDEEKARGAVAAQTIATALGAVPGKPMVVAPSGPTAEQMLDL